jgi:hypothetical protein
MTTTEKVDIGPYSKIPNKFFGSGTAVKLGKTASLVYLALCEYANRNGSNTFKASDRALASETGLGTRTICDARKRLCEYGLISTSRLEGQGYNYTLPKLSLSWVPLVERLRSKRKPRALYAQRTGPLQQNVLQYPAQSLLNRSAHYADLPRKSC